MRRTYAPRQPITMERGGRRPILCFSGRDTYANCGRTWAFAVQFGARTPCRVCPRSGDSLTKPKSETLCVGERAHTHTFANTREFRTLDRQVCDCIAIVLCCGKLLRLYLVQQTATTEIQATCEYCRLSFKFNGHAIVRKVIMLIQVATRSVPEK